MTLTDVASNTVIFYAAEAHNKAHRAAVETLSKICRDRIGSVKCRQQNTHQILYLQPQDGSFDLLLTTII